jgi:hypothetical protein
MAKMARTSVLTRLVHQEGKALAAPGLEEWRGETSRRRRLILGLLLTLILGILGQTRFSSPLEAGATSGTLLEDLHYQVDVLVWKDAVRGRLTLKSLGSGRYQAEISGQAQGLLGLLSGQRRDSYRTEMVCSQGKLLPVTYREESRRRGKYSLKEYRFHYDQGRVEMWQWKEAQRVMVRKWQAPLKEPIYDPLSAFYNLRLGAWGPLREGDTVKVAGIPYPQPEEIEVRMGPKTQEGRQAMVSFFNQACEDRRARVFVLANGSGVPTQAWTRVLSIGKIAGQLLPAGKSLDGGLPELPSGPGTLDQELGS